MHAANPDVDSAWWRPLQAQIGREYPRVQAWDAINAAMIRHWCQALGDDNPLYTDAGVAASSMHGGIVAPPAMLRAWLLPGYGDRRPATSAQTDATAVRELFAAGGYAAVLGTGSEEEYRRYLHLGDQLSYSSVLETVSELKRTRLGAGYFYSIRIDVFDQHEQMVGMIRSREFAYRATSV